MTAHPYNLRSRLNSPATIRTPVATPSSKPVGSRTGASSLSLQLEHVIGTTTKNSAGLSTCSINNSFAYCAGSVAVLARVDADDNVSHRYYRARPAVVPLNPSISYYNTPTSTPMRKRATLITSRRDQDHTTPGRALPEDQNATTWTARERIKSVKSVALSANGKFLAVGETGYSPRVLLFSTAQDTSTEIPLAIVSEHTWGVKSVAFSPDSRFLATLGESTDGFLFIWQVNQKNGSLKLCATNKCTSNICHMTWCGQQLITVGTRHIKIWQLPGMEKSSPSKRMIRDVMPASPSGGPTPLVGRNCLLGHLVDVTFTCAVPISDRHVLICTDTGILCTADLSKSPADLVSLKCEVSPAGAMGLREVPRRLVWAGGGSRMQEMDVEDLLKTGTSAKPDQPCITKELQTPRRSSALRQSLGLSQLRPTGTIAVGCLTKHDICIDADANLVLSRNDKDAEQDAGPLSSHNEPVQGVQTLDAASELGAFFTWSRYGEVRFWSSDTKLLRVEHIELDEGSDLGDAASNELKVLRHSRTGCFMSGDRFGVLKLVRISDWSHVHTSRAHSAEISDICLDSTSAFVATCSRDRMVQVFELRADCLDLIQTTDDHIAAVNQVGFTRDGNTLLSSSADRTIVVREKVTRESGRETLVAFLQTRIITIKASPLSMCLDPELSDVLWVSSLDRQITKIDFATGTIMEGVKVSDGDADDHAVLNSIKITQVLESGTTRSFLVGCSSTDKSVRLYDLQKQSLLSKESAHTEGISDLVLLGTPGEDIKSTKQFVSTGHDTTIMLWSVRPQAQPVLTPSTELTQDQMSLHVAEDSTPAKASPATLPPLRKVLTKVDIAEFVKTASPRSPLLRDPSPARGLRRTGSRLALANSVIAEKEESTPPNLTRRGSADDRVKQQRRSPSPPAYATKRQSKPRVRGDVPRDFFSRQSDWLRKSPEPEVTPAPAAKAEARTTRMRLRRPPSMPTDLRGKALAPQRRSSTLPPPPSDFGSMAMASEQTCRMLKTYKKRLQAANGPLELVEVEEELESVLATVKEKKVHINGQTKKSAPPKLSRSSTSTFVSQYDRKQSISTTGSDTGSPDTSNTSSGSEATATMTEDKTSRPMTGLGVEGISVLLERTTLNEV